MGKTAAWVVADVSLGAPCFLVLASVSDTAVRTAQLVMMKHHLGPEGMALMHRHAHLADHTVVDGKCGILLRWLR